MAHSTYWPNKGRHFMSLSSGNNWTKFMVYEDDGAVHVNCLAGNNAWTSMDNILFVPKSETLIDIDGGIGYQNSWVDYGDTWEKGGYYKDNEGNVFLHGLVKSGTINASMCYLPAAYRPQSDATLFCCISNNGFGRLGVYSTDGNVQPITGANPWYSLDGVRFPTTGSWTAPSMQNGWVNYSDAWGPPGYWKDGNGLVWLRGLVKSGTLAQSCFTLPDGYKPPKRLLLPAISYTTTYVLTRLDIETDGRVICQAGGNAWFSLWGACFYAAGAQSTQNPGLKPNWVTYSGNYMKEEAKIRDNKLVDVYGMIKSGTEPGDVFYLPDAQSDTAGILGVKYKVP